MAIKVVDEIPKTNQSRSNRDMIRADIQEALDKGIILFEFEGDYNYKYLAQYVKEEVDRFKARKVREVQTKFKEENLTEDEKTIRGFRFWFKSSYEYKHEWIKVSSCKEEDRRRVFCKIDDVKLFEQKIIEDCHKVLNEARAEYVLSDGKWVRKDRVRR